VSKSNNGKPRRKQQLAARSSANRRKPAAILTNAAALEDVIVWLDEKNALGKVRSATVAAARTLAARLDDPQDAKNARLWKEYREFVDQLIKIGEEQTDEFNAVLRGLEASLRDTPTN
jgi:hypothetical protein